MTPMSPQCTGSSEKQNWTLYFLLLHPGPCNVKAKKEILTLPSMPRNGSLLAPKALSLQSLQLRANCDDWSAGCDLFLHHNCHFPTLPFVSHKYIIKLCLRQNLFLYNKSELLTSKENLHSY